MARQRTDDQLAATLRPVEGCVGVEGGSDGEALADAMSSIAAAVLSAERQGGGVELLAARPGRLVDRHDGGLLRCAAMDLRLFFSTFGLVFLAEFGDKTQLATAGLAAESGRRWLVFAASAAALVTSSLLASLAGAWLHSRVDAALITRSGGALFVIIGAWMIYSSFRGGPA